MHKACNEDYDTFTMELKNSEFMKSIGNQADLNDNKAYELTQ